MPTRIKNFITTAATIASDDYLPLDGATNGTRKMLGSVFATQAASQASTDGMIFGAGSAAAPKLAIGTAGNGIYASAANTLDFTTNGVRSWQITSAGVFQHVGAGTLGTTTGDLTVQTGGGNGNFLFSPNGTGGVKIGNAIAPATIFHVSNTTTSNPRGVMSAQYTTDALSAQFHTRKGRGTEAAPTVIVTGDYLGRYVASGYDGSNYLEMGSIAFQATGTIAATRIPTQIVLSTATDATPSVRTDYVWIKPDGKVGVGTSSPATELHVSSVSTGTPRGIMSAQYTTDALGARFHMRKARGTEGSPTIVVTGDDLGRLQWAGYDGAAYQEMASIRGAVTGTVAAGRVPTQLIFSTATDASPSVLTDRVWISPLGNLLVGTGTDQPGSGGIKTTGTITAGGQVNTARYIQGFNGTGAYIDFGATATSAFTFNAGTAQAFAMSVSSAGVGIGTTVPGTFGLAVNQATGQCLDLVYNDSDGSPANHASFVVSSGGNLTIAPSGGTLAITGGLTVSADVKFSKTITAGGTTGAQTINKTMGSVNFAGAATSLVVTNSLVTTSSVILLTVAAADTTAARLSYTPGAGSFTINFGVAPTAETRVDFLVLN